MQWTAWNDGKHLPTGGGYGLHVPLADRNAQFKKRWSTVTLELRCGSRYTPVVVNTSKASFWRDCSELISRDIGAWLINNGQAHWPRGSPPRFTVTAIRPGLFRVR